jgi:hypothetical protein
MNNNFNYKEDSDDISDEKVSPKTKSEIQRLFLILLSIGLVLGVVVAFGVVKVLHNWGLTEKTPQFEHLLKK